MVVAALAVVLAALPLSGCGREPEPAGGQAASTSAELGPADQKYTTRALVVALPDPVARQPLMLHHEEIPEFVGKSGEIIGMKEMVMPFEQIAPGVSLDGVLPGDKIGLDFEVRWKQRPRTLVTRLEKLDPATMLHIAPKTGGE